MFSVNPERSNKLLFIKNLLMFKEFKDFAMKGNLIDIAVGLVMNKLIAQSRVTWNYK